MSDFSLKCYDGPWFGMLVIALAILAIFSIGVPAGFALVLYQRRHKLEDPEVKRLFAMLYQPYKPEFYYFESVVILLSWSSWLPSSLPRRAACISTQRL